MKDLLIAVWMGGITVLGMVAFVKGNRIWTRRMARKAELQQRAETEAYEGLDPALAPQESPRALARRVCTTVAEYSEFQQVAMLMRDEESRLHVVGSTGVDDEMALEVNGKVARFARERRHGWSRRERETVRPATLSLRQDENVVASDGTKGARQVIVMPLWSHQGELLGALAVWRFMTQSEAIAEAVAEAPETQKLAPLQKLAARLGRSIDLNRMSERLLGADRMPRMGRFVGA